MVPDRHRGDDGDPWHLLPAGNQGPRHHSYLSLIPTLSPVGEGVSAVSRHSANPSELCTNLLISLLRV
ncbi:protein of unknown function [Pseudomonas sp. JV241A]|nr:protein of unknown function [Pseudomonas sp. JV241A]